MYGQRSELIGHGQRNLKFSLSQNYGQIDTYCVKVITINNPLLGITTCHHVVGTGSWVIQNFRNHLKGNYLDRRVRKHYLIFNDESVSTRVTALTLNAPKVWLLALHIRNLKTEIKAVLLNNCLYFFLNFALIKKSIVFRVKIYA